MIGRPHVSYSQEAWYYGKNAVNDCDCWRQSGITGRRAADGCCDRPDDGRGGFDDRAMAEVGEAAGAGEAGAGDEPVAPVAGGIQAQVKLTRFVTGSIESFRRYRDDREQGQSPDPSSRRQPFPPGPTRPPSADPPAPVQHRPSCRRPIPCARYARAYPGLRRIASPKSVSARS